jgi:hypothetical protein
MIDDLDKYYDMPPFILDAAELLTAMDAAGVYSTGDLTTIQLVERIAMLLDAARCDRHRRTDAELATWLFDRLHKEQLVTWCIPSRCVSERLIAQAIAVG